MRRSSVLALACAVAVTTTGATSFAAVHGRPGVRPAVVCTGNPAKVHELNLTVDGVRTFGFYAVPTHKARGIVVFDHGYGHTAWSWVQHVEQVAARDGVIAIAMDYHSQHDAPPAKPGALPSSRGWRVAEGADDSIAAAKMFDATCAAQGTNTIYGVSMGGNTSGLVVAAAPKRANGSPLFNYWFAIEPAANVTETWAEATAVAQSGNTFGKQAAADIEEEMGGTPMTASSAYQSHSVVARIADIASAGLKGVTIVQGVDDGLVPYNQSRELVAELRAARIATDDVTAGTRGTGEAGTTASSYAIGSAGVESPFAGHGSEISNTQLVIETGFGLLDDLYLHGQGPACHDSMRDGDSGTWVVGPAVC